MALGAVVSFTTLIAPMQLVNVYHRPGKRVPPLDSLFPTSTRQTPPRLVVGDFNCPHPLWGYPRIGIGGRALAETVKRKSYSTDPDVPTRNGHSAARDTTPDLAFYKGPGCPTWPHTHELLGSDHAILKITLSSTRVRRRAHKPTKLTDWHAVRQASFPPLDPADPDSWLQQIHDLCQRHTKRVYPNTEPPYIDTHLIPVVLFLSVGAARYTIGNCASV
ncbi:hypothetical protein HPB48_017989 [Haemaphysalis longicornis]|uniref:Endonuclease/exonuclease/phosphatase domain-containing protein n=1 Tax=Haemaphysalis longicornis TaxID=44386 RepID=A0A9J6FJ25_HAELO|nr:hypothetical protein HPB48_017989 [Haemaphysalis longicornis]